MKFFRKLALAALLTALLTGTCLARETFHGAYLQGLSGRKHPTGRGGYAQRSWQKFCTGDGAGAKAGAYLHGKCVSGCLCAALGV